jgi:putative transport protein
LAVTAAITVGALVGLATVRIGGVEIGLSLAVGVLLGGLLLGWLRSLLPVLARVPPASLSLLQSLGLTAFLAAIALNAAPGFIGGVRSSGAVLLLCGFVLGGLPHILTVLIGRYLYAHPPGSAARDGRGRKHAADDSRRTRGSRAEQGARARLRRVLRDR